MVDEVVAVGSYGEGICGGFVESALPKLGISVWLPAEIVSGDSSATEIEDADLLAWERGKGRRAFAASLEVAVVGVHGNVYAEGFLVEREQGNVAQSVVFTLAGSTEIYDVKLG